MVWYSFSMKYYAVQVHCSAEIPYIEHLKKRLSSTTCSQEIIFPRRCLKIRKKGKIADDIKPIFPGYVFIRVEDSLTYDQFCLMKSVKGFYKFLDSNQNIRPLHDHDLKILEHFLVFGEIAGPSKVFFNEQNKIVVTAGPLKGMEGSIIKIDRRKRRAKVELDFGNNKIRCDLSFEMMKKDSIHE